jgi:hypothetical protein
MPSKYEQIKTKQIVEENKQNEMREYSIELNEMPQEHHHFWMTEQLFCTVW